METVNPGTGDPVGAGDVGTDRWPVGLRAAGEALAREAARYASFGWMRATSGNLSIVLCRAPLRLAVTASGLDKSELRPEDMAVVDAAGALRPVGPTRQPSAEAALHARLAEVAGAGAVVHVHTIASVRAADRWPGGVEFEGLEMLKALGRAADGDRVRIPVVSNSQNMTDLGDRMIAIRDPGTPAVLVARHGLYVWGDDLTAARRHTEAVQWLLEWALASG
ncbi:methylthioribulose 1-phosphate dehydratase [Protofrankia symbiont of Coriaria ruscifolia]|uniref:Methylthioribulose-1-phosphate dehydratase n=1 Tax=Candidatus Protofrankia californiensis TaxID=1839754 RepID=A0A1C3NU39_9ACTN|nr:methylthioribulose 1-phosphate dehydratase [Protofrankia symbiont of Coriaria ruscifolia]SBW18472.1 methylthioribulose-1-phosphate dehydratase [Candidatus Protofrankia californiensis]